MLVERHNLERLTTRYSYYPTDGQFVEVESYMAQQRRADDPDYYIQISHFLKPIKGHDQEVLLFMGCPNGRWIGRHEMYSVGRFVKHDHWSDIKGFRQIKIPKEKGLKWHQTDRLQ